MDFKIEFFRNIIPFHLSDVLDIPPYTGNENKYLKVKSDGTGVEFSDLIFKQDYFNEEQFNVDVTKNVISINDYLSKSEAKELFAPQSHKHSKSDISDFVETDYVHTSGDEFIKGQKIFTDQITFNAGVIFNGKNIQVDVENSYFKDKVITLANSTEDIKPDIAGIEIYRGFDEPAKLIYIESDKKWKIGVEELDFIATESEIINLQEQVNVNLEKIEQNIQDIQTNKTNIDINKTQISDINNALQALKKDYINLKTKAEEYFTKVDLIESIVDKTEYLTLPEGETTITLKYPIYTDKNFMVFRNGIVQINEIDYTLNNNEIVFSEPAELGDDKILVQYSYKKDE